MLIGFGLVLILILTIPKISKLSFAEAVPASCLGIILNMYLLSAIGLLGLSHWITLAEIICLAIYALARSAKKSNGGIKKAFSSFFEIITPAHAAFTVLCILVIYVGLGVKVFQWDEFSHWALTVKDMYYTKRLSIFPDSVTAFKSYPPGMALWQYFFMTWGSDWDEQVLVFAYNLFILFMMMPVFKNLTWENLGKINTEGKAPTALIQIGWKIICFGVVCFTVFSMPYLYYSPRDGAAWRGIYIDRALSFNLAYILFAWFSTRNHRENLPSAILQISLGAAVLSLLKSTGIFLAFLALVVIAVDMLASGRKKDLLFCLIPLAALAVAALSWRIVLSVHQVENKWSFDMDRLRIILSGKGETWMYNVIHEFPNRMKGAYMQLEREPAQLALAAMPVLWSVLFLLINHEETGENNKKAKRNILSFLAVFLCFLVFQVGLLLLYLCSFTSAEAQNFVSLERYNSEYILGITCFLLLYLIYVYHEHAQQHCTWKQIGCIGCLLLLLYNSVSFRQIYRDVVRKNAAVQASYDFNGYPTYMNLDTKFEKYLTPENKVYLVTENWLFSYYVLNYQLLPAKCNRTPDESFALNNLSEKIQMLKDENYTHICLCNLAPDFAERNAAFFEDAITTISLYEIIWDGEGAMKLINARPLKSL